MSEQDARARAIAEQVAAGCLIWDKRDFDFDKAATIIAKALSATADTARAEADIMRADLHRIGHALGIGAKPYSGHEAVERDFLPAITKLTATADTARAQERQDAIDLLQQLLAALQANHGGTLTGGVGLAIDTLQGDSHGWLELGDTK